MDRSTYDRITSTLDGLADPWESVQAVEAHRQFWRPARPRIVLLAESHVFTAADELVRMSGGGLQGSESLPDTFVRFVYCLGYGESEFVGHPVPRNGGTPQFWKILWSCLNDIEGPSSPAGLLKRGVTFQARIAHKRRLLQRLQDAGVWLVDASVVALYGPGGTKPTPAQQRLGILRSWDLHVRAVLREADPRFTIVIGKGVARVLGDRIDEVTGGRHVVLPQPQARMSRVELVAVHRTYFAICNEFGESESAA